MARGIDNVDFYSLIIHRHVLRQDRNPPLAFEVVIIEDQFAGFFIVTEKVALQDHFIDERGFAVVDVGNNRNIA